MGSEVDSHPDLGAEEVELEAEDMAGMVDVRMNYVHIISLLFIARLLSCDQH